MVQSGYIVRVLIASPGDVEDERIALAEIISNWNAVHSLKLGIIVEPVKWETHSAPRQGDRPHAIINSQLVDNCDIFVGIFWARFGSDTGTSPSGTVEEFEQFVKTSRPALLYFSDREIALSKVDLDQHKRLQAFKKDLRDKGLYREYNSLLTFREMVSGHLHSAVIECIEKAKGGKTQKTSKASLAKSVTPPQSPTAPNKEAGKFGPIALDLKDGKASLSDSLRSALDTLEDTVPVDIAEWILKELNGYDQPKRGVVQIHESEIYTANFPRYRQPPASNGSKMCVLEPISTLEYLIENKVPIEDHTFSGTLSVSYIRLKGIVSEVRNMLLDILGKYEVDLSK